MDREHLGKMCHGPRPPGTYGGGYGPQARRSSGPSQPLQLGNEPSYSVSGVVRDQYGRPLVGLTIEANDIDLRHEQLLGRTETTAPAGAYRIEYSSASFRRAEKDTADLRLSLFDLSKQQTDGKTPLFKTQIYFNAPAQATIDIVVSPADASTLSEYDLILAAVQPLLDGAQIQDLVQDDTHQDISFLAGETGLDPTNVQLLVTAWKANASTNNVISQDTFYGLFREGLPTDINALVALNIDVIMSALNKAILNNIIAAKSQTDLDAIKAAFLTLGAQSALYQPSNPTKPSPLADVLSSSGMKNPADFVQAFADHDGTIDDFWTTLDASAAFKGQAAKIQQSIQFGMVTLNHGPMISELQKRQQNKEFSTVQDLATFSESKWLGIIQQSNVGAPTAIPDSATLPRANAMAKAMTNIFEDTFPTQFVTARLSDTNDDIDHGVLSGKSDTQTFLAANPTFNIKATRLVQYLTTSSAKLDGVKNVDDLKSNVAAMQRIYSVAPQYTQMRTLVASGVTSSMQIARMGRTSFLFRFGNALGGEAQALPIYERASQTNAFASSLLTNFGFASSRVFPPVYRPILIGNLKLGAEIPDLSTLFGSMDMCQCEGCRAVDGPAAYLVDILHFLRDRLLIDTITRNPNGSIKSVTYKTRLVHESRETLTAKDILFDRRGDIGAIELTCENTNTPVPYIDLCIEILEEAVAPSPVFNSFYLPAQAVTDMDAGQIGTWKSQFRPSLTDNAKLTILKRGQIWSIDEQDFTYAIAIDDTSQPFVSTRSRQTKGTAAERAANPQYQNAAAYSSLAAMVYPVALPFAMWSETIRSYLAHIGVQRYQLMEVLSKDPPLKVLGEGTIAKELLGLTVENANIIVNRTTGQAGSPTSGPWNFWGFSASSGSGGIPDPATTSPLDSSLAYNITLTNRVDVFLQQSTLTYGELLNLLELMPYLRPVPARRGQSLPRLVAREGAPVDTCQLRLLQIRGLSIEDLRNIHSFIRLYRAMSVLGWGILDVGMAYAYLAARSWVSPDIYTACTEDLLVKIANIQRLMALLNGLDIETVCAFWAPISTTKFVDFDDEESQTTAKSLYDRIFRNQTVNNIPDPLFPANATALTGTIAAASNQLLSALNISQADLTAMQLPVILPDGNLTLNNLSSLYRHSVLAHSLEVSVSDYTAFLKITNTDPFSTSEITVDFVKRAQNVIASNFSLQELNYILRDDFSSGSGLDPLDDTIADFFDDFRSEQQKIEADNTRPSDNTLDQDTTLLKTKLPLLNLDQSVITQALSIFNGTASYTVPLATPPPSGLVSSSLGDRCTYDAANQILSFQGVMMLSEQQTLTGLAGASTDFENAVGALFTLPRTFLALYLRTFTPIKAETPLSALPAGLQIPVALRKKLYFDSTASTLHSIGALFPSELQAVSKAAGMVDPTTITDFNNAVQKLLDLSTVATTTADNILLGPPDVSALFDADVSNGTPVTVNSRIQFILGKLLPKLRSIQTTQALLVRLGQTMALDSQVTAQFVSTWLHSNSKLLLDVFLDKSLLLSSSATAITRVLYPTLFDGYTKLHKAAMVVNKFTLTVKQLGWLFNYKLWLDLDNLPLQLVPAGTTTDLFAKWERLSTLTKLRDTFPGGEDALDRIFSLARQPGVSKQTVFDAIVKWTNWNAADLESITGATGYKFTFPTAYEDEVALSKLVQYFTVLQKVGCSSADVAQLATPDATEPQSRIAVQTVKSKYDQPTWETVSRPLRNILRDKQRQALVAYLLANPPSSGITWRNDNDLFAYYLIDVDMGPCQLTSRIKQAVCSVQLFVQRCLMNLEPDVLADTEVEDEWLEWDSWLKSQVISSANRQIYMNPENFLDPSLRDDKTPFFTDFENDLQQNNITNDLAETAFGNYLEKLHEVSRLKVLSYYHETENTGTGVQGVDNLHVFAVTRGTPRDVYCRVRRNANIWDPWQKVEIDLASDHVVPVMWNRTLHLCWLQFTAKQFQQPITMPSAGSDVPAGGKYWEIKLAWTEMKNGKWLAKKTSDDILAVVKTGTAIDESDPPPLLNIAGTGRNGLSCKSEITKDNKLRIHVLSNRLKPGLLGYFEFDGIKGAPTVVDKQFHFTQNPDIFTLTKELVKFITMPWIAYLSPATGTALNAMSFTEDTLIQLLLSLIGIDEQLTLPVDITGQPDTPPGWLTQAQLQMVQVAALKKTPGTPFSLISAPQDQQFITQRPFFFQHDQRAFFVEPIDTYINIPFPLPLFGLTTARQANPAWLDGRLVAGYVNRLSPVTPIIQGPVLPPAMQGGTFQTIRTFPLSGGFKAVPDVGNGLAAVKSSVPVATLTRLATGSTATADSPFSIFPRPVNLIDYKVPASWLKIEIPSFRRFKFDLFYHPYVVQFMQDFNRDGIPGVLQRPEQQLAPRASDTFRAQYSPVAAHFDPDSNCDETVDFSVGGSYSQYNWELFYHIPMLVADKLSSNQQFSDAQTWLRYIFDPTDTSSLTSPSKYWKTKPFVQMQNDQDETISNIFRILAARGDPAAYAKLTAGQKQFLNDMELSIQEWRQNPFNPFPVARMRIMAFQMATVMKYLDNLIAWGDQLFGRDTIESINEATQLYILAANILGPRPADIPARATPVVQTYNSLDSKLDAFSNALVQIEELVPNYSSIASSNIRISPTHIHQGATPTMLFFCVPRNQKLMGYWDTVSDRLFKIRNCMNLQGIVRELALWDPPINPLLLIQARAAGVDISSVLSDVAAVVPLYRYSTLAAKAMELANEVRAFGSALLQALEKQDSEGLALLHSSTEISLLKAVRKVKSLQADEAGKQVDALVAGKAIVNERNQHYTNLSFMNPWEITHMSLEGAALVIQTIEAATQPVSAGLSLIPDVKIGAPTSIGATYGGQNVSKSSSKFAQFLFRSAGLLSKTAAMSQTLAGYYRRNEDWDLQIATSSKELSQFDIQIAAANVRKAVADKELDNHDLQTSNAQEIETYMRVKFSNQQLYSWTSKQVSALYFTAYSLAFKTAKEAEQAYCHELGIQTSDFIQFGYWDSRQKGLLAGERLMVDLKRLDAAYLKGDEREYEMTKNISLAQLNPVALLQFKQGGNCFFDIPEAIFDLECPGHYMRRLKSVNITIPCITGPYASVAVKLSLIKSTIRISSVLSTGKKQYARTDNDIRFQDLYGHLQAIVTSSAVNDSGTFEPSARDDRYMPFERYGAISSWQLQIPTDFRQFDYGTITDAVITLRYTAREGGDALKAQVVTELKQKAIAAIALAESQNGLARLIDLKHEMPDAWYRFLQQSTATPPVPQKLSVNITRDRLPYLLASAKTIIVTSIDLFVQIDPAFKSAYTPGELKFYVFADGTTAGDADLLSMSQWTPNTIKGASKAIGKPLGKWNIEAGLGDLTTKIDPAAIVQAFLVVHYTASW